MAPKTWQKKLPSKPPSLQKPPTLQKTPLNLLATLLQSQPKPLLLQRQKSLTKLKPLPSRLLNSFRHF
jgi:hypothetical protein